MIYIIAIGIALLLIFILVMYNSFVKADNKVKEAFATMDVYMKKRWDLIPNLVEVVKGYASHEKETLEEVIKYRNLNYDSLNAKEKIETGVKINDCISKIMMIAESYPELKASENFLRLSSELTSVENDIANARKYYNGTVRQFNNKVEMFPNNILAGIFGYTSKKWFEATGEERNAVKVDLWKKLYLQYFSFY